MQALNIEAHAIAIEIGAVDSYFLADRPFLDEPFLAIQGDCQMIIGTHSQIDLRYNSGAFRPLQQLIQHQTADSQIPVVFPHRNSKLTAMEVTRPSTPSETQSRND